MEVLKNRDVEALKVLSSDLLRHRGDKGVEKPRMPRMRGVEVLGMLKREESNGLRLLKRHEELRCRGFDGTEDIEDVEDLIDLLKHKSALSFRTRGRWPGDVLRRGRGEPLGARFCWQ